MAKTAIIIPVRMGSTRLPGKALAMIGDKPMVVHVYQKALEADCGDVFVAAGDDEIVQKCRQFGIEAIKTDADLASGTDRISQAFDKIEKDYDIVVNLQGDLPLIEPDLIKRLVKVTAENNFDIVTAANRIEDDSEIGNPNIVKVVISWFEEGIGNAVYFSRSAVPHGSGDFYHHIGIYVYKAKSLERFVFLPPSQLEKREKLEQLRALENSMKIGVVKTDQIPFGVDTEEDLQKVRKIVESEK